ncbi:glycosyltransferase [candidate division KSB1 bacterium]|nr:glycosyltransferase [candidate division KSB1 bacterium]
METCVIIPTYNRAHFVNRAVLSVIRQKEKPDEIIIIDDGSTDNTATILNRFEKKINYIKQTNFGVSAARNTGILNSKSEWICFLDSDDFWMPAKLEMQKKALRSHPEYKVCYTNEVWIKNNKHLNQSKKHTKYSGWIYEKCLPLCIISPSSVMIHRTVFEKTGLFDESMVACEDYDLWLRITNHFPVLYLPEKLITKNAGSWPQLSRQHSLDKLRIRALFKILNKNELSQSKKNATINILIQKCNIYKSGCLHHSRTDEIEWIETIIAQVEGLS